MQGSASRFGCPSSVLRAKLLLRGARATLWLASLSAIAAHLSLAQIRAFRPEQRAAKPLTTHFVKRQPRLSKPLELKKRPHPKRRTVQREMVSVKARIRLGRGPKRFEATRLLRGLARPRAELGRALRPHSARAEPVIVAGIVQGSKEPENRLDMSLEMIDIDALDTGRYHALVIQDPQDKRNISGFFRLKNAYTHSADVVDSRVESSLRAVVDAMNQYTDIRSVFAGRVTYDSQELLKTPWVFTYLNYGKFKMSAAERTNLGKYLTCGGFYFLDSPEPNRDLVTPYPASNILFARSLIEVSLETRGLRRSINWVFEYLENSHPIFHCFFDFDGPPPCVYDRIYSNRGRIEGVHVLGRWCMILTQKAFKHFWNDPNVPQWRNERLVQFGVNTIVFALTQEGSITHQLMDEVR